MKLKELEQMLRGSTCKIYYQGNTITTRVCDIKDLEILDYDVLRIDLDTNEIQVGNSFESMILKYCIKYEHNYEEAMQLFYHYRECGFADFEAYEHVIDEIVATSSR